MSLWVKKCFKFCLINKLSNAKGLILHNESSPLTGGLSEKAVVPEAFRLIAVPL